MVSLKRYRELSREYNELKRKSRTLDWHKVSDSIGQRDCQPIISPTKEAINQLREESANKMKMSDAEYIAMLNGIKRAHQRHPNCKIAACDCNSKEEKEWKPGCHCMCHFFDMDRLLGKDKWSLTEFNEQAEKGLP